MANKSYKRNELEVIDINIFLTYKTTFKFFKEHVHTITRDELITKRRKKSSFQHIFFIFLILFFDINGSGTYFFYSYQSHRFLLALLCSAFISFFSVFLLVNFILFDAIRTPTSLCISVLVYSLPYIFPSLLFHHILYIEFFNFSNGV